MRKGKKWKLKRKRYIRVTVTLTPNQVKKLKRMMQRRQMYMSEIIREAVEMYLNFSEAMEEGMKRAEEVEFEEERDDAYEFYRELAEEIRQYREKGYSWYAIAKVIEREHGLSFSPEEVKEILKTFG